MTDELLIKFLLNETTEEEDITVQKWLTATPANHAYFEQFEKIWQASKKLAYSGKADEQQAWLKFKEKVSENTAGSSRSSKPHNAVIKPLKQTFSWLKIAAIFLLTGAAWMAYTLSRPEQYKNLTADNQVQTEQLPDGSELTLNKNSQISYAAGFNKHRNVKLIKGDVFFKIAHDATRPFIIAVNKVSVTVVGTSFNIKYLNGQTEVIVETGLVRVELNGEKIELHKGEKVLIGNESAKLIKEVNTDDLYNYYRSNLFIANNTPLKKLIAVMNEAYGSEISISDPELAAEIISTTFKVNDGLENSLKVISATLDIKITRNKNKILLSGIK